MSIISVPARSHRVHSSIRSSYHLTSSRYCGGGQEQRSARKDLSTVPSPASMATCVHIRSVMASRSAESMICILLTKMLWIRLNQRHDGLTRINGIWRPDCQVAKRWEKGGMDVVAFLLKIGFVVVMRYSHLSFHSRTSLIRQYAQHPSIMVKGAAENGHSCESS